MTQRWLEKIDGHNKGERFVWNEYLATRKDMREVFPVTSVFVEKPFKPEPESMAIEPEPVEIREKVGIDPYEAKINFLVEIIPHLAEKDLTASGAPKKKALESVLGEEITELERDEAWNRYMSRTEAGNDGDGINSPSEI